MHTGFLASYTEISTFFCNISVGASANANAAVPGSQMTERSDWPCPTSTEKDKKLQQLSTKAPVAMKKQRTGHCLLC